MSETERFQAEGVYNYLQSDIKALEGNLPASFSDINKAIKNHPDIAFLYYQRAELLASTQQIENAVQDAKRAIELDPDTVPARLLLAKIYATQERHEEAIALLEGIRVERPEEQNIYPLLTREYMMKKEYNQAVEILNDLLEINPEAEFAYYYLATIYGSYLGNIKRAEEMYKKLLEFQPESAQVYSALAQLYLDKKMYKKALPYLTELEKRSPNDLSAKLRVATVLYEGGKTKEALEKLRAILDQNSSADKVQYYAGIMSEEIRQPEMALEHYSHVPEVSSYFKESRVRMAIILRDLGRVEEAIDLLQKSSQIKSKESIFYELLAAFNEEKEDYSAAIAVLEEGATQAPTERIYFSLAALYDREKKSEKALSTMKKVLELNPKNAQALNFIGYTLVDEDRQLDEAEKYLLQAVELKPTDGYIVDSVGWLRYRQGHYSEALQLVKQALRLTPSESIIWKHLGDVYLKLNKREEALQAYRHALRYAKMKPKNNAKEIEEIRLSISTAIGPSWVNP